MADTQMPTGAVLLRELTEEGRRAVEFHDVLRSRLHKGGGATVIGISEVKSEKRKRYDPTKKSSEVGMEDVWLVRGTALDQAESVWLDDVPVNFRVAREDVQGVSQSVLHVVPQLNRKRILVVGAGGVATKDLPAKGSPIS